MQEDNGAKCMNNSAKKRLKKHKVRVWKGHVTVLTLIQQKCCEMARSEWFMGGKPANVPEMKLF